MQESIISNYKELFDLHTKMEALKTELLTTTKEVEEKLKEAYNDLPGDFDLDLWVEFATGQIAKFDLWEDEKIPNIHFSKILN